jgi:outer membrane lipoprotein-sorting protein
MSKKLYCLLLLSILVAFKPAQVKLSLDSILASINWTDTFQATFIYTSQEVNDQQQEELEPIQGQIWVKGPKYHLILDEQEIICNGQLIWNYLPQANEVQISTYDPEQEALDPVKLLTLYKTGFLPVSLKTQSIDNRPCDIIEFVVQDPDNLYTNFKLVIDLQLKQIKSLEALDTNGYYHNFLITSFQPNPDLADNYFAFNPSMYRDVEVVDLR